MDTIQFNISTEKLAIHAERILRLRADDYQKYLTDNSLTDTNANKKEYVRNGIDFYLTSQRYAQSLGKKLKKTFKGELKISSKLFTVNRQTSKNVYRVNVLFRL